MSWLFGLGGQGQGGQVPPNLNLDIPGLPPPTDGGGGAAGAAGGEGGGKGGGPTVPDFNSGGLERAAKAAKDLEQSSKYNSVDSSETRICTDLWKRKGSLCI